MKFNRFSKSFYVAIFVELLHCLASYSMMAYLVIYLSKDLNLGDAKASFLMGTMFFMGYFLPIFIGAIADRKGFKETMTVSLILASLGYFYASTANSFYTIFIALMMLSLGGAVMKPVIAGTVKLETNEKTRTLGFSIYYIVINIGSFFAPFLANLIRIKSGNPKNIFILCTFVEALAFLASLLLYKNPEMSEKSDFSFGKFFKDLFDAVKDFKLLLFIIIYSGVWALYSQIWSNIPLYIVSLDEKMKERIEYFQMVDPIMIILFQYFIGKFMSRFKPLPSIIGGLLISMVAVSTVGILGTTFGAVSIAFSLALWAIGEMMFSPRAVEYVSLIAPKDKLALYIGFGFLPLAIGLGVGPYLGTLLKHFLEGIGRPNLLFPAMGLFGLVVAISFLFYDKKFGEKH
jgi:POT family proton-dependent oligopeptide transporter